MLILRPVLQLVMGIHAPALSFFLDVRTMRRATMNVCGIFLLGTASRYCDMSMLALSPDSRILRYLHSKHLEGLPLQPSGHYNPLMNVVMGFFGTDPCASN